MIYQTLVSVVSTYGIAVAAFLIKKGLDYGKIKLGDKKYQQLVTDCRVAVGALWDANKVLGLDKIEEIALKNVVGSNTGSDIELVKETIQKVIKKIDSMSDDISLQAGQ